MDMLSAEQKRTRDKGYRTIQRHWKNGLTESQIAKKLGISQPLVANKIHRMRQTGWKVPYRHDEQRRLASLNGKNRGGG